MKSVSSRRANIAIALVVIFIIGYVSLLLVSNYISHVRLVDASQKQFIYVVEKQALAVQYFLNEREKDLTEISSCRELSTYFENKALGMSLEYGLTTSLLNIQKHFNTILQSRHFDTQRIYDWIALIGPDGKTSIITSPEKNKTASVRLLNSLASSLEEHKRIIFVKKGTTTHALFWKPYFFKEQVKGYIVADMPLTSILDYLIDAEAIRAASQSYIFCSDCATLYPEDTLVSYARLDKAVNAEKKNSGILHLSNSTRGGENLSVVYATIGDTNLKLLNVFPEEELSAGVKPRNTLLIMLLLSLLIFVGVGLTFRKNIQKQLLARQVEESLRNAEELNDRNKKLSAEIFERTKVEKALENANKEIAEASAVLNCMLKSATEFAIAAIDTDYRIIHFNPAAERILGVKAEEVMGKRVIDIHSLKDVEHDRFRRGLDIAQKDGKYEYDILRENPNGEEQRMHAVVMPMYDDLSNIVGFNFFALDTTQKYMADEKLRISEERYRTLLENIPDIVFSVDQQFVVRDINMPPHLSYGLEAKDIIGKPLKKYVHKNDHKHLFELTQSDINSRRTDRRGLRFRIVPEQGGCSLGRIEYSLRL
ncbi:PAS domain S-box protein [Desulforhopalus sp. IMCC35007]|nr:PAS domain S-box protein [Desulforhopalus sp. IMCC35007]